MGCCESKDDNEREGLLNPGESSSEQPTKRNNYTAVGQSPAGSANSTPGTVRRIDPPPVRASPALATREYPTIAQFQGEKTPRTYVAFELLSTEVTYVRGLQILVEFFLKPLTERVRAPDEILSREDIRVIFSDIEIILNYNSVLLEMLDARMRDWGNDKCVGDIFLRLLDYLKVYTVYVNNYSAGIEAVAVLQRANKRFDDFIKDTQNRSELNGLDLVAYLILPVQRIPRYVLMLHELHKRTDPSHPDYKDLTAAKERMEAIADVVNERKRDAESLNEVWRISDRLEGGESVQLLEPTRKFVKEGSLKFPSSKGDLHNGVIFLFNDQIVFGRENFAVVRKKGTFRVKHSMPLKDVFVRPAEGASNELELENTTNSKRLKLIWPTVTDRAEWEVLIAQVKATMDARPAGSRPLSTAGGIQ